METMNISTLLQELGVSLVPFSADIAETFPAGWFVVFVKQPILQECSFDPSKSRGTAVLGWCLHSSERQCQEERQPNLSSCPKTL